eukprot:symbB.v1.2.030223.t1/scaffold3380.1/size79486/9
MAKVTAYVYDITQGMAAQMSLPLIGACAVTPAQNAVAKLEVSISTETTAEVNDLERSDFGVCIGSIL